MIYFDESVKKRDSIWFYQLIFNVLIFIAAAIMTGIFIYYNYEYILNPELSPGYNEGAPFGDGGAKFGELIIESLKLYGSIFLINIFCFCASFFKNENFLSQLIIIVAALLVLNVFTSVMCVVPFFSVVLYIGLPLEIPAAIVFLVIFWKKNKKGSFISLLLLFIQYIFMFALDMFDTFLFLD